MGTPMSLTGKKALVTGAAEGIGRGCALALAAAGADVALNDRSRSAELLSLAAEIETLGRQAVLVPGDAFDRSACEQVVEEATSGLGQIDLLVSNPAFSRRGSFLDYDPALFERTLQGTLLGGFHASQLVARHLVARAGPGKIVFISSIHAEIPYVQSVAYNAAKAGLNHMARTMAAELLPHRINVNVIEPGWIDTPGERRTFGDEAITQAGASLPWGRLGTPDDIGRAATFLCSEAADYITGMTLLVDGGLSLRAAIPAAQPQAHS
jgi:glucose 1-dehydrogenase